MKTKRIMGLILSLSLVISLVSVPGAVSVSAAYSDNVLLEYGFDTYAGGGPVASGTGVTVSQLTNQSATNKLYAGETADGNKYLYSDFEAYCNAYDPVKTSWSNVGFQLNFDAEFATTGKYVVSFDVSRGDLEEAVPSGQNFAVRFSGSSNPFRLIAANATDGKFFGYSNQTINKKGTAIDFLKNTVHRVDILFDLDSAYNADSTANGVAKVFVDGQLLTTREYTEGLAGKVLQFRLEHEIPFFDNLKVTRVSADSFGIKDTQIEDDSVTFTFTETMESYLLSEADFAVENAVTGEEIAVDSVMYSADSITLGFETGTLKTGNSYSVKFSDNVKSIGGTLAPNASFAIPTENVSGTAYYEEFELFTDDQINVEGYADMKYEGFSLLFANSWTNSNPFKGVEAVQDGEDDKAIRIYRNMRNSDGEANTFSDMRVTLPHDIYFEGEVSIEYRISVSEDTNAFRPYLISATKASNYQLAPSSSIPTIWYEGQDVRYSNTTAKHNGTATLYKQDEVDSGFHTYRADYNFDEKTVDIYFDGEKINDKALVITNFEKREADGCFRYIDLRHNGTNGTSYVDIDYVKVTQKAPAPYVMSIGFESHNGVQGAQNLAGTKYINVSFGGNIASATLTEDTITLYEGEEKVAYKGSFDPATRTYSMNVPGLLAGNASYKLDVTAGAKDPYGNAVAAVGKNIETGAGEKLQPTVLFSVKDKEIALADIKAEDNVKVTATIIDTTREGSGAQLMGALFNGETFAGIKVGKLVWNGCVGTATAILTVEDITELSVKAFLFDGENTLSPAIAPTVLE